ncbi:cleavage and polyadenylation specificity factor subunit 2, partial [Bonamia ostreae]
QIFLKIAQNRKNLLLLTQRSPQNTIAGVLQRNPMAKNVDFKITETEYLTGEELEEHLQFARETEREIKRMEKSRTEGNDIEIIDEDIVFSKKYGKKRGIKKRKIAQIYPMFPFPEKYFVSDDYGEKVDFLDLLGDSNEDSVDDDVISVEFSNKSKKFIKRDERNRIIEKDKDSNKEQKTEKMEDIPVKTVTK